MKKPKNFERKIISILIIISIIALISTIIIIKPFSKADDAINSTDFSGGSGTKIDPYQISKASDIEELSQKVNYMKKNSDGIYYKKSYYILTQDIDMSNVTSMPIIGYTESTATANCTTNYSFQGDFNGNGYTISGLTYTITTNGISRGRYGLFGNLWGDGTDNASVYNLSIDNMNIILDAESADAYNEIVIGTIAGHLGENASIRNCIVKNSSITVSSKFKLYTKSNQSKLKIGGIVGETSKNSSNDGWSKFTITEDYGIENCYANVNITVNDDDWEEEDLSISTGNGKYCRYSIGGILGGFCNVNKFPENCIYEGTIQTTKAFASPSFGNGEFDVRSPKEYDKLYVALGSTDTEIENTNYYYNTKIINNKLSTQEYKLTNDYKENHKKQINGTEVCIYPLKVDATTNVGAIQGVNRGDYIDSLSSKLSMLNSYSSKNTKYKKWYYNSTEDILSFSDKINIIIQRDGYKFKLVYSNIGYDENTLKYEWYIDGVKQAETENYITVTPLLDKDRKLVCKMYSGTIYIGKATISIEKETINLAMAKKSENNKEILYVDIKNSGSFGKTDFTYQWYYKDKGETEYTKIDGETNYQYDITNAKIGREFKAIVKLDKYEQSYYEELYYTNNDVIFVDQINGNDANDGKTDETAVKTLAQAYKLLPEENEAEYNVIVIIGTYNQNMWTAAKKSENDKFYKPATICGKYLDKDYSGNILFTENIYFNANLIIKDIQIDSQNIIFMYAQGNDLTLEESVKFSSRLDMQYHYNNAKYWGVLDIENYQRLKAVTIVGGTLNYKASTHDEIKTRTSNIIVKCTGISVITAGSRTQGDLSSDVYGTINKHSNAKITVDISDNNSKIDVGLVVGGQCDSSCYINSEINIENGKIGKVIGGTLGYGNEYTSDIPRDTFYGSSIININGGNISDVFGGPLGRNKPTSYMYGQVIINIAGGTIENIYGAGSGGTMGYSSNSTDQYKDNEIYGVVGKTMTRVNDEGQEETYKLDESEVVINITGGTIENSVYGGGYGKFQNCEPNPEMADDGGTLYGNTTLNITGGVIKGSVYGGSKGIEDEYTTSKPNIAQIYGNITVNISGNADIRGSVYGGSEGLSKYANMSKIVGKISINIDGQNVRIADDTNIYGGGKAGQVDGTITLIINDVNLKNNIYGAGDGKTAIVENIINTQDSTSKIENKIVDMKITNSVIDGTIYGGGNSADVYGSILVNVTDKSNITGTIYGGCNNANVGKDGENQNIYVYVSNAIIGQETDTSIVGGEVFGGGNLGTVYGNTTIEIGSENSKIKTVVGKQVYAGGRGKNNTTVIGNSTGKIIGTNTEIAQYGSSDLGTVDGIVDIYFENYAKTSGNNKYKTMSGINKATNIYLTNSLVYLTGGLENIENLFIPQNSGMMISNESILDGDFCGGGKLDIKSGSKLIIKGNLKNEITTLTLSPKQNDEGKFQILGGEENPYVVVLGTDESNGTGMISEDNTKYVIENNPETDYITGTITSKVSIYYIDNTIPVNGGLIESIYNIEDKMFTSPIDNTDPVYIVNNGAFTSKVDMEFSMIRQKNDDDEWEFSDNSSMKNIRRYIYLSGNNSIAKLPQNTKITMIFNNKYYSYTIQENYGTEEFWNSISSELGVADKLDNQIPLCLFKDSAGNKYSEITNIQDELKSSSDEITQILTTTENYRFIFDFSNCTNNDIEGTYEVILNIINYGENNTKENVYTEYDQTNIIKIESRNYKISTNLKHEIENQKVPMDFKINFKAGEISKINTSDVNKNIKFRISLVNENSELVDIPIGTIITIDGEQYDIISDEVIYDVIKSLQTSSYDKTIDLQIDLSNVADSNLIENGKYSLKIDTYLADEDVLLENIPLISSKTEFTFKKAEGYGIKVSTTDSQVIYKLDDARIINIKTETGTLEDGAYINIKTYKRQDEFKYIEIIDSTSVESQQITNLNSKNLLTPVSTIIFKNEGIHRYVYQLCDKYGNVMSEDFINFIVRTTE